MTVKLSDLRPVEYNPRAITDRAAAELGESIDAFGFLQPLVVNRHPGREGRIVGGQRRFERLLAAGLAEVPTLPDGSPGVVFVDLPLDRERELNVRLNRGGTWDGELLAANFEPVELEDWGFDQAELEALLPPEALAAGPDAAPPTADAGTVKAEDEQSALDARAAKVQAIAERWQVSEGDVWRCGDHVIWCGDVFSPGFAELVAPGSVDLVVTDPPFAIYGSSTGVSESVTDDAMVRPFFRQAWEVVWRALKFNAHAYLCCDWRSWAALWEAAKLGRMSVRNMLVWDKQYQGLGSNYANTHELVAFAHKTPEKGAMKSATRGTVRVVMRPNVISHAREWARLHNAQKPLGLFRQLVENSSNAGELVLDPFGGSGTTMVAAEVTGRRAILADLSPQWVAVTLERWTEVAGGRRPRRDDELAARLAGVPVSLPAG